jgi:2-polyprenyl-3-methyl-5-hydroxy-6-metoxy-1,4-benzoquinol methylase
MNENCEGLLDYIVETLSKGKCLHLGCGTSTLSKTLAEQGVRSLVNCDYSEIVIKNMQEKYTDSCGEWYNIIFIRIKILYFKKNLSK